MSYQPEHPDLFILWIEDEADKYEPIGSDLRRLFQLEIAVHEEAGLQHLRAKRYDLVLLDLMLPHNDEERARPRPLVHLEAGQRILRSLRDPAISKDWKTPTDCLVIVWTARGNAKALEEIIMLIGTRGELMQKPIYSDEMVEKIRTILLGNSR